ncbi:hypothetical protein FACS1894196_2840 [Clostridia bacterium]|nr:hypothetical protein FACS1894196_2840 [Clostridia bacterium]
MKKLLRALLILCLLLAAQGFALAEPGFSANPDAIADAAKSVLLLYTFDRDDEPIATGSGFVAFDNGTLITNYHVIQGAHSVLGVGDDGETYYSIDKVYAASGEMDIAILGFDAPVPLNPLPLAENQTVRRAEPVVAIGSPQGILNLVSQGIISGVQDDGYLFTAPISSGNSGGALFNDRGEVIGIPSWVYVAAGEGVAQNLNFAIRIDAAISLYGQYDGKSYQTLPGFSGAVRTQPTAKPAAKPTPRPTAQPKTARTLVIPEGAYADWELVSRNKNMKFRISVRNTDAKKTVRAFELYLYATDVWGETVYGADQVYYWTTTKNIKPGSTVKSDYTTVSYSSDIQSVHVGIHRVIYTDGTSYTVPDEDIVYDQWDIK